MWLPIFGLWFPVLHTTLLPFSMDAGPLYDFYTILHLLAPVFSCGHRRFLIFFLSKAMEYKEEKEKKKNIFTISLETPVQKFLFYWNRLIMLLKQNNQGGSRLGRKCMGHFCAGKKFEVGSRNSQDGGEKKAWVISNYNHDNMLIDLSLSSLIKKHANSFHKPHKMQ